jgi:protein O-mannosyl-transferase
MPRDKQRRVPPYRPEPSRQQAEPSPSALPRPRPALAAALCAALAVVLFAVFGGLLSSDFVLYDDAAYVTGNTHVLKGLSRESVSWAFTSTEAANWHPLTWLSHMLDVQLFGLNGGRHHATSLLLHTLNALLLLLLLFRMTGALWRSAFVAALFALHPLHVESVAWIAERKDVLSTLFWLLTTGAWLAYLRSKKTAPYVLMLVFFALGLMAKPMLVTLPFTLLLLDFWPLRRIALPVREHFKELKQLVWEKAPLFTMTTVSCIMTIIAQRGGGAVKTTVEFPLDQRVANAAQTYAAYLAKTVWPSSLAVFYPHPHTGLFTPSAVLAFLLLAAASALAFRLRRQAPYVLFGWLWYLGTLVPVIGLLQVGVQAMADRYTYIPLIGIFAAAAWGLAGIGARNAALRRAAPAAAGTALAALAVLAHIQAGYWAGNETLFMHTLAVSPENDLAHYMIGSTRQNEGRVEEAVAHLSEAVRINPDRGEAHNNLGIALEKLNRTPEALDHFREALRVQPHNTQVMNNLGLALVKMRRLPEALEPFEEAVRLDPDYTDARNNLGNTLAASGRLEEAVAQYRQVLKSEPDSAKTITNMGMAYGRMDRLDEAIQCFRDAVRLHPDYADAHLNLGVALARTGRAAEAIEQYRSALNIQPDNPKTLDNLGLALGMAHRDSEALEHFRRAVEINPGFAEAHFHLAVGLMQTRHPEEAREHLRKALEIRPDFSEARQALERMGGGRP